MNTHQLEIFFYVAKYMSVSKAASHLFISQPAVSSQLKKLESDYSVRLIEKSGRGIRLTYIGEQLYEVIQSFFTTTIPDVEALLKNSRYITVSGNYLMTQFILPEIIGIPHLFKDSEKIVVKSMSSTSAINDLKKDYCDLVLVSSSEIIVSEVDFSVVELFQDEILLVSRSPINEDLSSIIVSKSKKATRDLFAKDNSFISNIPVILVESTHDAIANTRINSSAGTFISSRFLKHFGGDLNYIRTGIRSTFYAVYRKNNSKIKVLNKIIESLKESEE